MTKPGTNLPGLFYAFSALVFLLCALCMPLESLYPHTQIYVRPALSLVCGPAFDSISVPNMSSISSLVVTPS